MDMEFIRRRITELRLKRGISEYQLSYDLGHSKNYIHNIVTGYSQPSVKELLALIEELGVKPKYFLMKGPNFGNLSLPTQLSRASMIWTARIWKAS